LYFIQNASYLFFAVYAVDPETQSGKLPCAFLLKGSHALARRLQFHESQSSAGEKYQAVGHSIKTGRYEFGSKPTTFFCLGDELPLD
jgi:hypothetical protein